MVSQYRQLSTEECVNLYLRRQGKRRVAMKVTGEVGTGLIPGRVDIGLRPKVVDAKSRIGDLGVDLIIGRWHHGLVLTVVDRKSKYAWLVTGKKAAETTRELIRLQEPFKYRVETITADNGKGCTEHGEVAATLDPGYHLERPYHSWERILSEHTNGLARRYSPKRRGNSRRGELVEGGGSRCCRGLSPKWQCLSLHPDHVSSPRSSNPACGFPALGSHSRSCARTREAAPSARKAHAFPTSASGLRPSMLCIAQHNMTSQVPNWWFAANRSPVLGRVSMPSLSNPVNWRSPSTPHESLRLTCSGATASPMSCSTWNRTSRIPPRCGALPAIPKRGVCARPS